MTDADTMTDKPKDPVKITRHTVRVKPHSYQPKRGEVREEFTIPVTPDELAAAILQPVEIVEDPEA